MILISDEQIEMETLGEGSNQGKVRLNDMKVSSFASPGTQHREKVLISVCF